ncbi:NAD(P)H-dependent oxidoreductase [Bacillus gobiensis]|uniref:NAD(P)H-dependent oxidoreductase n=1 Tax=Bacillus gobiensis TaxID=1441095 RepID=UPI003D1DA2D5
MKNILLINGHEVYPPQAKGTLNQTIFSRIAERLEDAYSIQTTVIQDGYDVSEEQKKFEWADAVIFQTPIYWFSIPGSFKTYIDQVYQYGVFFTGSDEYGQGGLFTEKKYMLSLTWNSPDEAFLDENSFFEGKNVDEALFHFHKTQAYVGMKPLKTFSLHDVISNPAIDQYLQALDHHLGEVFSIKIAGKDSVDAAK